MTDEEALQGLYDRVMARITEPFSITNTQNENGSYLLQLWVPIPKTPEPDVEPKAAGAGATIQDAIARFDEDFAIYLG